MAEQDALQIKEKIVSLLRIKGPSLPVHISSQVNLSILFTSAFLAELLSEKRIKMSNMRVGSSPIYFLPDQEPQLERYAQHIKGKEKEALMLLKEKKVLKDIDQQPAIRVALRSIRDFAIPFKNNEEIYWRYFTTSIEDIQKAEKPAEEKPKVAEPEKEEPPEKEISKKESLDIFDSKPVKKEPKKKVVKKLANKKNSSVQKTNDKFFNKVKEYLSSDSIEIINVESFGKNELVLRINQNSQEKLLVAYNKKKVTEDDIIKANKKASETGTPYIILSLGEPMKKLSNLIEAIKNLSGIEKIE